MSDATNNNDAALPVVRVSLDLTPSGVRNVLIFYSSDEQRDEAIQRLNKCLGQLELLEAALQGSVS
jgi:hypothetical protein